MSAISTAFDDLNTALASIYSSSTYRILTNPYVIELNDSFALNRGYGFYLGAAFNTERYMSSIATIERQVILTNSIVWRGTERDVTIRQTAEKQLLEDQFLAINYFTGNEGFSSKTYRMKYTGDEGIEFGLTDKINFLIIRTTFSLEYGEEC